MGLCYLKSTRTTVLAVYSLVENSTDVAWELSRAKRRIYLFQDYQCSLRSLGEG